MKMIIFAALLILLTNSFAFANQTLSCTTLGGKSMQMTHAIATGDPEDDEKIISLLIDGRNAIDQIEKFNSKKGRGSLILKNGTQFNFNGRQVLQLNSSGRFQPLPCSNIILNNLINQ